MIRGKMRARSHVTTRKSHAREEKSDLAACGAQAHIRRHCQHRARAGTNAIDGRDDRLRAGTHGLDQITGHAREGQQAGHIKLGERADDLVDVAAGAEIFARAGQAPQLSRQSPAPWRETGRAVPRKNQTSEGFCVPGGQE